MPNRRSASSLVVAFLLALGSKDVFPNFLRPVPFLAPNAGAGPGRTPRPGFVDGAPPLASRGGHRVVVSVAALHRGHQAVQLGKTLAASCLGPTLLGLWRSEYGVSYGYGTAVALSAYLLWRESGAGLAATHLLCLILYGARLNVFLLWRELSIPRFRDMRDRIEERSKEQGGRLNRLPFIVTCALLYLGLVAPGVLVFKAASRGACFGNAFRLALFAMYVGWGIAAFGDLYKSIVKAKDGEDALVTSGPFAFLRHPNYTGEQLLWSANFVAGLLAAATLKPQRRMPDPKGLLVTWLPLSVLGLLGIIFVLMQATAGLEKRQREKYGQDEKYQSWLKKTWPGLALRSPRVTPESDI